MIYILLPAYNEEASIPDLIGNLELVLRDYGQEYQIVVCNDGSKDRTREMLEEYRETLPIHVINHPINRGLGETARDMFEYTVWNCQPDDIIIRMDCDITHEPKYIPDLVAKLDEGFDVVIASRFQPGGDQKGVNAYRGLISRCANIFMKVFFPVKNVKEYSCGYRAYRAQVMKTAIDYYGNNFIQLRGLGFTCTLEKLIKLSLIGARFAEVPFVLRYDKKVSQSKMVSSITTLGYMTMAVMYHWPWGGWRRTVRRGFKVYEQNRK